MPLTGEGSLVVYVFDPARADGQGSTVPIEGWRIDKDTLHRLERKDFVGLGYTLFLPWSSYRPDLKSLEVRAQFEPAKGSPIYAQPTTITLNNGMPAPTVTSRHENLVLPQPGMSLSRDPAANPPPATTKTQDGATITLGPQPGARLPGAANDQSANTIILDPEPGTHLPGAVR